MDELAYELELPPLPPSRPQSPYTPERLPSPRPQELDALATASAMRGAAAADSSSTRRASDGEATKKEQGNAFHGHQAQLDQKVNSNLDLEG